MKNALALVVLSLALLSVGGCSTNPGAFLSMPASMCVGQVGYVHVDLLDGPGTVEVANDGGPAFFTGEVLATGGEAVSTGRVLEVTTTEIDSGVSTLDYEVMCVHTGVAIILGEYGTEDGRLRRSSETETYCEPCDGVTDALDDFIDSVSINLPTFRANFFDLTGGSAKKLLKLAGGMDGLREALARRGRDGLILFANGTEEEQRDEVEPRDGDDIVLVSATFAEDIPRSTDHSLIYSAVFDSDGVEANNWVAQDPFDWDLFQGADRWYQMIYDHTADTWSLRVTQVDGTQGTTDVLSGAFAVVTGPEVSFFIPGEELPGEAVMYRVTSFGHDGQFSEDDRGADVLGENPTEPLQLVE